MVSLLFYVDVMSRRVLINFIQLCGGFMVLNWLRGVGKHTKISYVGRWVETNGLL